jgi:hypothetical protein
MSSFVTAGLLSNFQCVGLTVGCVNFRLLDGGCDEEILPEILREIGNKDMGSKPCPRRLFSAKVSPPAQAGASISARVLLPHTRAKTVAASLSKVIANTNTAPA